MWWDCRGGVIYGGQGWQEEVGIEGTTEPKGRRGGRAGIGPRRATARGVRKGRTGDMGGRGAKEVSDAREGVTPC